MKWLTLSLILLSVSLSAVAQIVLKTGMSRHSVSDAFSRGTPLDIALQIVQNSWVIGGLGLYFLGAVFWLFVLARVEVSYAYPFVGLGFVATMLLGHFLMEDSVGTSRVMGTLLIAVGIVLIARS